MRGLKLVQMRSVSIVGFHVCTSHEASATKQLVLLSKYGRAGPADTARPPVGLNETLQEGPRRHSSDLERAESLVRIFL